MKSLIAAALLGSATLVSALVPEQPAGATGPGGFNDVSVNDFFADGAAWLKQQGYTTGYAGDPTAFAPGVEVDRGQMAAFLWRISGEPAAPTACGFADIPTSPAPFYAAAACWMKAMGITTGYGGDPTWFAPGVVIDRSQMAAFLWRWVGEPPAVGEVEPFDDVAPTAFFALATRWLKSKGLTTGYGGDPARFAPQAPITRGQMAAFLHRMELMAPVVNEPADEVVLTEMAEVEFLVFDREGPSSLRYDGPESLVVGSILVLDTPDGPFYGRVVDIDGDVIHTVPAGLDEVIPELSIDLALPIEVDGIEITGLRPATTDVSRRGLEVSALQCDTLPGLTVTPHTAFDPGQLRPKIDLGWRGGLKMVELVVDPSFELGLEVSGTVPAACTSTKLLATLELPNLRFSVGPVPVVIMHQFTLELELSLALEADVTIGFRHRAEAELGVRWTPEDGFESVRELDFENLGPFDVNLTELEAQVFLPVAYETRIYGAMGLDFRAGPVLQARTESVTPPCHVLESALRLDVQFAFTFFRWKREYVVAEQELLKRRLGELGCEDDGDATVTWTDQVTRTTTAFGQTAELDATYTYELDVDPGGCVPPVEPAISTVCTGAAELQVGYEFVVVTPYECGEWHGGGEWVAVDRTTANATVSLGTSTFRIYDDAVYLQWSDQVGLVPATQYTSYYHTGGCTFPLPVDSSFATQLPTYQTCGSHQPFTRGTDRTGATSAGGVTGGGPCPTVVTTVSWEMDVSGAP